MVAIILSTNIHIWDTPSFIKNSHLLSNNMKNNYFNHIFCSSSDLENNNYIKNILIKNKKNSTFLIIIKNIHLTYLCHCIRPDLSITKINTNAIWDFLFRSNNLEPSFYSINKNEFYYDDTIQTINFTDFTIYNFLLKPPPKKCIIFTNKKFTFDISSALNYNDILGLYIENTVYVVSNHKYIPNETHNLAKSINDTYDYYLIYKENLAQFHLHHTKYNPSHYIIIKENQILGAFPFMIMDLEYFQNNASTLFESYPSASIIDVLSYWQN